MLDYYEILEVHPKASQEIIKKAYTLLAKKYHPDVYPDKVFANKKMALLNEAYAILSDPQKRKEYDFERGKATTSTDNATKQQDQNANSNYSSNEGYASSSNHRYERPTGESSKSDSGKYSYDDLPYEQRVILMAIELANIRGETLFRPKQGLSLKRVNGIGETFLGKKEEDFTTGSYITNYWFTFFFIPIIPIREYRVIKSGEQSYFIISSRTSEAFKRFRQKYIMAVVAIVLTIVLAIAYNEGAFKRYGYQPSGGSVQKSSSNYKATNKAKVPTSPKSYGSSKPMQGVKTQYVAGEPVTNDNGYGSITIDNSRNDCPVYVRIWSLSGNAHPVRCFTIAKGGQFSAEHITPGRYDVRYKFLYEDKEAQSGSKSEAFNMVETQETNGIRYSKMSLTLYRVRNGNTTTSTIPASEI